ncbi:MAG TPA: amidohydrolase [Candidatus Sutterella merdavium]|nr:amidohydrolase [Candidatus Sutterella merdavium]
MTKEELKAALCAAIEKRLEDIRAIGLSIAEEPELGYKEVKTSAKVQEAFDRLGIAYETGFGVTGVKARLAGAGHRRTVALLGELDAIVCREHPMSDPVTGAAHCCGHNVQIANLVAVAMAVKDVDAMKYLGGDLVLFAVPAEEYVEIEYRNKLREEKKIEFLGGKAQIIAEGGFDDVDMALQMHVDPATHPEGNFQVGNTSNGFIGKLITYRGKAAHAAGAPDKGVNALNACMMGVMGVNAIRETFREEDCVRFHPIINSGGDLVNVIPDYVKMESYVRASNLPAMKDVNARINRALEAGAMALGAECDIHDLAGYLPMKPDENFRTVLRANAQKIFGAEFVTEGEHAAGSTDMGDVSHLMPVVHPWVGCVSGVLHGANYRLTDEKTAFTKTPQVLAGTIVDLLWDDAAEAERICAAHKPELTKAEYLEYMRSFA